MQREPDLNALGLVSTNQDVGFTNAHQGGVGNVCDTGELEILGALIKIV